MRKILTLIFAISIFVSMFGCSSSSGSSDDSQQSEANTTMGSVNQIAANETGNKAEDNIVTVTKLIENFGEKLQLVSLLSDDVRSSMQENYSEYVNPELLSKWQQTRKCTWPSCFQPLA